MKVKNVQVKKMLHRMLIYLKHLTIYPHEEQFNISIWLDISNNQLPLITLLPCGHWAISHTQTPTFCYSPIITMLTNQPQGKFQLWMADNGD